MRSNKTGHGAWVRIGVFAVSTAMTIGLTGCSGGGHGHGHGSGLAAGHTVPTEAFGTVKTQSDGGASGWRPPASTGSPSWTFAIEATFTQAPAEFAHPPRWSLPITLSRTRLAGFGNPILATGTATTAFDVMADQAKVGMVAVIGNVVAVPSFGAPAGTVPSTPPTLSVELLDSTAGKALATVPIPDAIGYYGMDVVTIGSQSAVEVRYEPKPTGANTPQFASILLDQTGNRLWSSAGEQLAGPATYDNGLVGDQNTGIVHEGGFVERVADPDPLDTRHTKSAVSVLDLTGRTVLTVQNTTPGKPGSTQGLELVGGYAVEASSNASSNPSGVSTPSPIRFTVYDLPHGAKKVATFIQPMDSVAVQSGGWRHVLAACGDRLLMQWPQISQSYSAGTSSADLAVLDLATGRITAPVAVPSDVVGTTLIPALKAISAQDCSTVLVSGTMGVSRKVAVAVDWATGRALWQHLGPATIGTVTPEPSFLPLVLHGDVVYGLQNAISGDQVTALGLADGQLRGTSPGLNPVAFTADGAPVFIQYDHGTPPAPTPRPTPSTRLNLPPVTMPAPDLYPITVWVGATDG
ncbi:hypothetical protein ABIA35_008274 [Catenulispora sp. MAP12-49]